MMESAHRGANRLKPAFAVRIVVGIPRAGPTCFAIPFLIEQRTWVG
jgi:hypothetical protein